MAQVITFEDFLPPPRYDGRPWTTVQIEEAATADGTFALIDTQTISPVDVDPAHPAYRSFTTELASETVGLWYRLIFLDGTGDDTLPTEPIQNLPELTAYATVDELARILKIRAPTSEQRAAMNRVLLTASEEIDSEIDLADGVELDSREIALARGVCLDRAADLWRHTESIPGVTGLLGDDAGVPIQPGRYSWERYAQRLAPLKDQWGLA